MIICIIADVLLLLLIMYEIHKWRSLRKEGRRYVKKDLEQKV